MNEYKFDPLFHPHLEILLNEKGKNEIRRHARVSRDNRHECQECFTCYCMHWLERRGGVGDGE